MKRLLFRTLCGLSALLFCGYLVLQFGDQNVSGGFVFPLGRTDYFCVIQGGEGEFSTITYPVGEATRRIQSVNAGPRPMLLDYGVLPRREAVLGFSHRAGDFSFFDRRTPRPGRPLLPPDVPPASTWRIVEFPLWPAGIALAILPLLGIVRAVRRRRRRGTVGFPASLGRSRGGG